MAAHAIRRRPFLPRPQRARTAWLSYLVAVALTAALVQLSLDMSEKEGIEGVLNGSAATDLSGWRAGSDAGPVMLTRVPIASGPKGTGFAVDVRRAAGQGKWTMALADLRTPETFFQVGRTYRMQLYVRDVNASGRSVGLLLANPNYAHRPTKLSRYEKYDDDSWHLLTQTFVCLEPGSSDTALYLELPSEGSLHWQVTAASVREVPPLHPPRVKAAPTRELSFTGPAGTAPDPQVWNHELGGNGWGNDELQTYTASTSNASLDGAGHLVITARREDATGPDRIARRYTSARITTEGKLEVQPGSYVEASIRAPVGAGVWPAFWLIGSNIREVGWPACGEIDVLEVFGGKPTVAHSTIHMARQSDPREDAPYGGRKNSGVVDLGHSLDTRMHRYGVYFDGRMIRFYIDRAEHLSLNAEDARASGRTWPFDRPHYIILNVAVGGTGDPSATSFPRTMVVGDVSIWQGGTPF